MTTLTPETAKQLSDARRQLHHAAQLATAAGISYLPAQPDDSHTNLEWLAPLGMLASNVVPSTRPFRLAVRATDLTLAVLDASNTPIATSSLHGQTMNGAAAWIKDRLREIGTDPSRFTLRRHYEVPHHAVDDGAAFDTSNSAAFAQLSAWYSIAADVLASLRGPNVSDVRCWPHHFDIAILITLAVDETVGVGMEPGDVYYDEPYFYVNHSPSLSKAPESALGGHGSWHTREWIGAVLPVSRLSAETALGDVRAFLDSAIAALS
jgi:hypothetical protein